MDYTNTYNTRNSGVDIADIKCEEFLVNNEIPYVRYGFDQQNNPIEFEHFSLIPTTIRSQPDFIVFQNQARLLEVKGCRDVLRLKKEDIEVYEFWWKVMPLSFFIYSCSYESYKLISYRGLVRLSTQAPVDIYADNNKEYYKIDWQKL
ncbi:MAG TPA: hypothetical protein EYN64_01290 [Flavobacteriales bacterium]|nr:hypothetical protein [Flavobacteriales bacterium]